MSNFSTSAHPANVIDLAADEALAPEVRVLELNGQPEQMMNADAVIAMMRNADTPEARATYRSYRKAKSSLKRQFPGWDDAKLRQRAMMAAFKDAGHRIVNVP